eukprot:NODE_3552_length_2019_cov_13.825581.p1 GENE.NODE_3552_length_2019_cov_13.825581~~NODE_3552_length_2019_cov_13.825581.p1  ORF type:complete len:592 (-),score=106.90 NODE_3552_length_2019_cov_13.825581:243-1964(-)
MSEEECERLQCPVGGLTARPFWPAEAFAWAAALEAAAPIIAEEFAVLFAAKETVCDDLAPGWRIMSIIAEGCWHMNARCCRATVEHLLRADVGIGCAFCHAYFSMLMPGAQIRPHCGASNAKLRAQLVLRGSAGGGLESGALSVAGEARPWEDGKLLVFDDSLKHTVSVAEDAASQPVVLFFDFWHPELKERQRQEILSAFTAPEAVMVSSEPLSTLTDSVAASELGETQGQRQQQQQQQRHHTTHSDVECIVPGAGETSDASGVQPCALPGLLMRMDAPPHELLSDLTAVDVGRLAAVSRGCAHNHNWRPLCLRSATADELTTASRPPSASPSSPPPDWRELYQRVVTERFLLCHGETSREDARIAKLVLVGDDGIGKTCLMRRAATNTFTEEHISTIGVWFNHLRVRLHGEHMRVQIWDTAGSESFFAVQSAFYHACSAVVFCFDVSRVESLAHVRDHLAQARAAGLLLCSITLVALKTDLLGAATGAGTTDAQQPLEEGRRYAAENGLGFAACSAKLNDNIDGVLETVLTRCDPSRFRARTIVRPAAAEAEAHASREDAEPSTGIQCSVQ